MKLLLSLPALLASIAPSIVLAAGQHAGGHGSHAVPIGQPGQAKAVRRTIDVRMTDDMRFTPSEIHVHKGETVRLRVTNAGRLRHELVLGDVAALKAHAELMQKFPDMEHDDPNAVSVAPGKTDELIWRFTRDGTVAFACLQPAHYEAGMKGVVFVKTKASPGGSRKAPPQPAH